MNSGSGKFVVATPSRTVCDDNARALERIGRLRFLALGTRRGTAGVPAAQTRLNPWIGLCAYAAARALPASAAERFRTRLLPWFDRWVKRQLAPGDHIISSYGYVNDCFAWVRAHGGKTFLDGGNSHPEHYWQIVAEEHARWNCPLDPFPRQWFERAKDMMPLVDYVLSPSRYVTRTFLERGFRPEQMLSNVYPLDLACFRPATTSRPADRPLTIICTASLSLRKGSPYLLEAFEIVRRSEPNARLFLTSIVEDSMKPVLAKYRHLPIDWAPGLPHAQLAERLRQADVFVLPSLEDGFARTVAEALACGLPVITTPNTGASDLIVPGENGEVVPIRDPQALADAMLKWWTTAREGGHRPVSFDAPLLSFEHFEEHFLAQLRQRSLLD